MFCPKCGAPNPEDTRFCAKCGEFCGEFEPTFPDEALAAPVKRKKGKAALVAFFVLLVAAIGVVAFMLLRGGEDIPAVMYYVKDNELYMVYNENYSARKLTKNLFDDEETSYYGVYSFVTYLQDKNILIYPDKMSSIGDFFDDYECSLYYTDTRLSEADKEVREKIDDHIISVCASPSGDYIYYVTLDGDSQTLYYYDFEDSEKVISAKKIYGCSISEDGEVAYFVASDNDDKSQAAIINDISQAYIISDRTKTEKVLADADFEYATEDLSVMVFSKDGKVFVYNDYTKVTEVPDMSFDAENEYFSVVHIDEGKNIYYSISLPNEYPVRNYINDDAENMDIDDFYWADYTFNINNRTLYMYNGSSVKKICENFGYAEYDLDKITVFSKYDYSKAEKLNLSKVYDDNNITWTVENHLESYCDYFTLENGKMTTLCSGKNIEILYDVDDYFYYITRDDKEDLSGDLHRVKLNGTGDKVIDTDVYIAHITEDGDIYALKDPIEDKENDIVICDLFYNDEKIASDVYGLSYHGYYGDYSNIYGDAVYFKTDFDDGEFTLNKADGKKVTEVVDGIDNFASLAGDVVLYMNENDDGTEDVYALRGDEEVKIDKDIQFSTLAVAVDYKEEE